MGHHYTPIAHLKRFGIANDSEHIWMFDKESGEFRRLPCKKVAQAPNFYPTDVEVTLNYEFEIPGNESIKKVLQGKSLSDEERIVLAAHMVVMRTRGPRHRRTRTTALPGAIRETIANVREELFEVLEDEVERARQLAELEKLEERWKTKQPDFLERLRKTPFISPGTVQCLYEMTWEIVPAPGDRFYITSDTPAHYFEDRGIGKKESEFSFPLSSEFALVAHHQGKPRTVKFRRKKNRQLTDEINKRIISTSEKFLFASKPEEWMILQSRKRLHLSLVRWL